MNSEILLFIIKLVAGGLVAFMSIVLMSKNREPSWMFMVAGFLFSYAAMVFELLIDLGVLTSTQYSLFGIPVSTLACVILPAVSYLIAFILMLCKK